MSSKGRKKFPFEFQPLPPKELEELKDFYVCFDYARVGPKGYVLSADYEDDAENIYNMPLGSDDVIVYSFPRSGTTWTQELVWLINTNLDYEGARSMPLTRRYTFLEFPSIFTLKSVDRIVELNTSNGVQSDVEYLKQLTELSSGVLANCPSPRFIKTHLPLSFLPPGTVHTAKVVYVARDPRDAAVSFYYLQQQAKYINFKGDFKEYWNLFKKDLILWCPFFEHLKEAWALRHHPNMLFLFYEELSKDLPSAIRRVADFFGKKLSEEQVISVCDYLAFENFKKNKSVNSRILNNLGVMEADATFVRKGKTGGWRDHFDEQMSQEAERWIQHNLRGTDLRFPHLDY